jgi:hypothetical protein
MRTKKLVSAIILSIAPSILFAQETRDPLQVAGTIDACNGASPVSAEWLEDGRLGVTCPRGSVKNAAAGAGATNLAIPLLGVVFLGALAGGSGSTSSTNGTN